MHYVIRKCIIHGSGLDRRVAPLVDYEILIRAVRRVAPLVDCEILILSGKRRLSDGAQRQRASFQVLLKRSVLTVQTNRKA